MKKLKKNKKLQLWFKEIKKKDYNINENYLNKINYKKEKNYLFIEKEKKNNYFRI